MHKAKIITIGSLTFDIFVKPLKHEIVRYSNEKRVREYLQFPFGEKIRVSEVHECFGGGAANTAISFSRLGIPAVAYGAIGNDKWGELVKKNLEDNKVDSSLIQKIKGQTAFSVILNSFEGERTVLAYSGASQAVEKIDEKILREVEAVYLCHLSGKSAKLFNVVRKYFEKKPEKFLIWNPGKEQIENGLKAFKKFLPVVDVLCLNREEAEEFTKLNATKGSPFDKVGIKTYYDCSKIFKAFYKSGFKGILVITDGRRGAQASDGKKIFHCDILTGTRADTLGAGDSFSSAFSAAIFQKKDLQTAIKYGTLNATSMITQFGAQNGLLMKNELEKKLKKTKFKIQFHEA